MKASVEADGHIFRTCALPYTVLHTFYAGHVSSISLSADSIFKLARYAGPFVTCSTNYTFSCLEQCREVYGGKVECRREDHGALRIDPPTCLV